MVHGRHHEPRREVIRPQNCKGSFGLLLRLEGILGFQKIQGLCETEREDVMGGNYAMRNGRYHILRPEGLRRSGEIKKKVSRPKLSWRDFRGE